MAEARAQIKFRGRKCGRKVKSRLMPESTRTHEMNLGVALAVWAALLRDGCASRAANGIRRLAIRVRDGGLRDSAWQATWSPAAPRAWRASAGVVGTLVAAHWPCWCRWARIQSYALGVAEDWRSGAAWRGVRAGSHVCCSCGPGERSEFPARLRCRCLCIGLPVQFRWMYWLFPFPPPLTHTLTILLAVNAGLAAFIFARRLPGIGYAIEWRRGFANSCRRKSSAFYGDRDSARRS